MKFKGWRNYRSRNQIKWLKKRTGAALGKSVSTDDRFWYSREIQGNINRVTVKRDALGDWYITVLTDLKDLRRNPRRAMLQGSTSALRTF